MIEDTPATSGGYILLARRIKHSELYLKKPIEWRAIWIHILLSVNWAHNKPQDGLKAGSGYFCFILNSAWLNGVSVQTWKRCIKYLKDHRDIITEQSPRGLTISVLNFTHYQDPDTYRNPTNTNIEPDTPQPKQYTLTGELDTTTARRVTWLTKINDVWRRHMQADIHFKKDGKTLSKLLKEHPEAALLPALDAYLADAGKMASIQRFASTVGQWLPKSQRDLYPDNDPLVRRQSHA
jgi:hypothetical protein